jgi:UDP-N-acetylglucosamine 2-epimerase (non-hydrolysing)
MTKLLLVAGARPNFMKISPILRELEKHADAMQGLLVHTGQHYDHIMSASFFEDLGIKEPDYNLEVGSGSHAVQTANIMIKFEEVCLKEKPDMVLVVGDVNSTIATGLVAKKIHIDLAHVEAGLRSRDRAMPEEINRMATDAITDIFFTTENEGTTNLLAEGHDASSVHFVGHVMIDNLFYQLSKMGKSAPSELAASMKKILPQKYICMTMHRPSNVDNRETLSRLLNAAKKLSERAPVVFPCHPRTKKNIQSFGLESLLSPLSRSVSKQNSGFFITEPLGYDDFLYLWKDACLVLTDSGGLQEETTALKIPCITMRENTERPITAEVGSNVITGTDATKIEEFGQKAIEGNWKKSLIPDLWDGKASERIVEVIRKRYGC